MSLKIYLITGLIALITSVGFYFVNFKISLGIILSTAFSLINLFILQESMKMVISKETPAYALMFISNSIRFTMLFAMLYIAYKFPQYFSMGGVAIGLILFMFALIIDTFNKRRS